MRYKCLLLVLPALILGCEPADQQSIAQTTPAVESVTYAPVTDLVEDAGWVQVQANCSGCHSLSLVTQNRMTRSNWINTIRWMQKKQGLWDLGADEPLIVDYLEKHYGVADVPWRRKPLENLGSE